MDKVDMFKSIMGNYPTGVTVVTTYDNGTPLGLTVNSFASVSLEPMMVLFCVDKRAGTLSAFQNSKKFAVNVLAADQAEICFKFASRDADRFANLDWSLSERELPVIANTMGLFECQTVQEVDAGDHIIFIGEVLHAEKFDNEPMLYFRRKVGAVPAEFVEAN